MIVRCNQLLLIMHMDDVSWGSQKLESVLLTFSNSVVVLRMANLGKSQNAVRLQLPRPGWQDNPCSCEQDITSTTIQQRPSYLLELSVFCQTSHSIIDVPSLPSCLTPKPKTSSCRRGQCVIPIQSGSYIAAWVRAACLLPTKHERC